MNNEQKQEKRNKVVVIVYFIIIAVLVFMSFVTAMNFRDKIETCEKQRDYLHSHLYKDTGFIDCLEMWELKNPNRIISIKSAFLYIKGVQ